MVGTILFLLLAAFVMIATVEYYRTRRGPLILLAVWATHITASHRWLRFALSTAWSLRTRYHEFLQQAQWEVAAPRRHLVSEPSGESSDLNDLQEPLQTDAHGLGQFAPGEDGGLALTGQNVADIGGRES